MRDAFFYVEGLGATWRAAANDYGGSVDGARGLVGTVAAETGTVNLEQPYLSPSLQACCGTGPGPWPGPRARPSPGVHVAQSAASVGVSAIAAPSEQRHRLRRVGRHAAARFGHHSGAGATSRVVAIARLCVQRRRAIHVPSDAQALLVEPSEVAAAGREAAAQAISSRSAARAGSWGTPSPLLYMSPRFQQASASRRAQSGE